MKSEAEDCGGKWYCCSRGGWWIKKKTEGAAEMTVYQDTEFLA
jgi:hypothetical protein